MMETGAAGKTIFKPGPDTAQDQFLQINQDIN